MRMPFLARWGRSKAGNTGNEEQAEGSEWQKVFWAWADPGFHHMYEHFSSCQNVQLKPPILLLPKCAGILTSI